MNGAKNDCQTFLVTAIAFYSPYFLYLYNFPLTTKYRLHFRSRRVPPSAVPAAILPQRPADKSLRHQEGQGHSGAVAGQGWRLGTGRHQAYQKHQQNSATVGRQWLRC